MIIDCPACSSRFLIPDAALGTGGRTVRCGRCKHQWFQSPNVAPLPEAKPAAAFQPQPLGTTTDESDSANAETNGDSEMVDHVEERRRRQSERAAAAAAAAEAEDEIPYFDGSIEQSIPYDERLLPALRARQPASLWLKATALSMSAIAALLLVVAFAPQVSRLMPSSLKLLQKLGAAPSHGLMLADVGFEARDEGANHRRFIIGCAVRNTGDQPRALPDLRLQIYTRAGEKMVEEHKLLAPIPVIAPGDDVPCDIPSPAMRPGTAQTIVLDVGSPVELWKRTELY